MTRASVVIPAYNCAPLLRQQLEALEAQVDPAIEVLVVDNGSTDDLVQTCADFEGRLAIRVVPATERQGPAYARNVGARQASADILLFCDADDIVQPGWVEAMTRAVEQSDRALAAGRLELESLNSATARRVFFEGTDQVHSEPFVVQGYLRTAWAGNMAIGRRQFVEVGGYDMAYGLMGDEDTEFSWRAQEHGLELVVVPEAVIAYRLRDGVKGLLRQRRGWSKGRVLTYVRSLERGRAVTGMSLKWTVTRVVALPVRWLQTRRSLEQRMVFARDAGALLGNFEGQLAYRVLRRAPAAELF
ncbi:glycosyltransferase family 2 protein [Aestuariimicrobium ganziense]|uniref:glycosyltransferase family 2 protein n=1 Tax=Aestuariimicrobium ganziense TaxID=2773677 RepID=UPI001941507B|nr:glycosyltransferase family A protein [Aestuariimicrobium ganziense]